MSELAITVRGASLAISEQIAGPLVVRAHGMTQSRGTDQSLGLIDWGELAAGAFRVLSYDTRGHGHSTGHADPDVFRWDRLAEDLLELIDHVSPDAPVRAVGISQGSATILTALTIAPHRFAAVALGAPPTAWETRAPQVTVYEHLARAVESTPPPQLAQWFAQTPVPPIFTEVPGWPGEPAVPHALLPAVFRGASRSDLPSPEKLAGVDVPSLILAWHTDPGHPIDTARRLADIIPNSVLHVSRTASDIRTWAARTAAFFDTIG